MVYFYCTVCGARLQVAEEVAGQQVRCANCLNAVRSPEAAEEVPFAELAAPLELSYVPLGASGGGYGYSRALEQAADRLRRVENDVPTDDEGNELTTCGHCGSHIAAFIRTCPYCRNQLWGA